jgi:hypothetical protein
VTHFPHSSSTVYKLEISASEDTERYVAAFPANLLHISRESLATVRRYTENIEEYILVVRINTSIYHMKKIIGNQFQVPLKIKEYVTFYFFKGPVLFVPSPIH